jgi:hypothetical protein
VKFKFFIPELWDFIHQIVGGTLSNLALLLWPLSVYKFFIIGFGKTQVIELKSNMGHTDGHTDIPRQIFKH